MSVNDNMREDADTKHGIVNALIHLAKATLPEDVDEAEAERAFKIFAAMPNRVQSITTAICLICVANRIADMWKLELRTIPDAGAN